MVVHAHDIHFPYNVPYPVEKNVFGMKWPRLWTETMLLQAFLAYNSEFETLLSTPLLRHHDEAVPARPPFLAIARSRTKTSTPTSARSGSGANPGQP